MNIGNLGIVNLITAPNHIFGYDLVQVKRHKKKRINKKYIKKYGYKKLVPMKVFVIGHQVYCPECHYEKILKKMQTNSEMVKKLEIIGNHYFSELKTKGDL